MSDVKYIERMTDLLKSGATMLQDHCPSCNSPLFRVKGEVWCVKCDKRVITVSEGEEPRVAISLLLSDVEQLILLKIQESSEQIVKENDIQNLERLSDLLIKWFEALEKVKHLQKL